MLAPENYILLGRIFVGLLFIYACSSNILHWHNLVPIAKQKFMLFPKICLIIGITWQLLGGLMIIFGWQVKIAALSLVIFTILAPLLFHAFWQEQGIIRNLHRIILTTHYTATIGGLLLLAGIY